MSTARSIDSRCFADFIHAGNLLASELFRFASRIRCFAPTKSRRKTRCSRLYAQRISPPPHGALEMQRQADVRVVGASRRWHPRRILVELESARTADHVDRSIIDRAPNGSFAARAAHPAPFAHLPDRRAEPARRRPQ